MSTQESGLDPDLVGSSPPRHLPRRGPASFPAAVARAPSSGGAGLASPGLPLCVSHGPEGRAAPGAELTRQDPGAHRWGSSGAAGQAGGPAHALDGEGPVPRSPCGPAPAAGLWGSALVLASNARAVFVRSGLEGRGLGLQARGCCVGNNGEGGGHWVGSLSCGAWRGWRNRKPGGIPGTGGCGAGRPYPAWPDAHVMGWWWEGLVLPPSTPGLDPGCQGLSGSVEVWILRWVGDQVRRGDLV